VAPSSALVPRRTPGQEASPARRCAGPGPRAPSLLVARMDLDAPDERSNERCRRLRELAERGDFAELYRTLQSDVSLHLDEETSVMLLNNIPRLVEGVTIAPEKGQSRDDAREKMLQDAALLAFRRVGLSGHLRGFGSVQAEWPDARVEMPASELERTTGLPADALSPQATSSYWPTVGVAALLLQFAVGAQALHPEPEQQLAAAAPALAALLLLLGDQLLLRGAAQETALLAASRERRGRVARREAGKAVVAYLLGCPLERCVTSPLEARAEPRIPRGASSATLAHDPRLVMEVRRGQVSGSSVDRLSVRLVAGLAAEALRYGGAETGQLERDELSAFLKRMSPPWDVLRVRAQERWALAQAVLLLREHSAAVDAAAEAIFSGGGVGDVVRAIEGALPRPLPADRRREERAQRAREESHELWLRWGRQLSARYALEALEGGPEGGAGEWGAGPGGKGAALRAVEARILKKQERLREVRKVLGSED